MVDWLRIIQETLLITSFVIVVMLIIEFLNVNTEGKLIKKFSNNNLLQIIIASFLGLLPGCLGVFTVVSLFTHRIFSFGALMAAMIATTGDEAYFMIALMPKETIIIFSVLAVLSILVGIVTDKLIRNKRFLAPKNFSFDLHHHDLEDNGRKRFSIKNLSLNPKRLIILGVILTVISLTAIGVIGHSHSDSLIFSLPDINTHEKVEMPNHQHNHSEISEVNNSSVSKIHEEKTNHD
ncbi:MAG TPA: putative manganese transporter, partial [Bacteroidales bacterium]|nr:putative manganese transporter [Bacteroidales bacterium]